MKYLPLCKPCGKRISGVCHSSPSGFLCDLHFTKERPKKLGKKLAVALPDSHSIIALEIKCKICGKNILTTNQKSLEHREKQKYCSNECNLTAERLSMIRFTNNLSIL